MERKLGRFPDDDDLSVYFMPGVRFYFRYSKLTKHPDTTFEGVLPLKIRDEVDLEDWACAIIVPDIYREMLAPHVPKGLRSRVHYIDTDSLDIWKWSEKAYEYVKGL